MATIQQYSRAQDGSLQQPRSSRLAGQAATAALYVTQPERRLSMREPAVAETQALKDPRATGQIDLSHASAGAALAHAKSRRESLTPARTGTAGYQASEGRVAEASPPRPSSEVYKAALSAVKESRVLGSVPPVKTGYKHDVSTTPDEVYDIQRESADKDKAIRAASDAYRMSRLRADSAPSNPSAEVEAQLADIDNSLEASRINHLARTNAQLYTERPFAGLEAKDRRNSLQAATLSMSRDISEITETPREEEQPRKQPSAALQAAQRGHARMQSQRSVPKTDPNALQQAISLQQAAQQRAAEKLAKLHEESYQEYYGVDTQAPRPGLSLRLRRGSVDSDTSTIDAERSREIRYQMTSLRSRLNAVDDRKTQDRASLMEAARRKVNATMHDIDMNIYNETGRPPPSMQQQWEDEAMERAQREIAEEREEREEREYYEPPDRVNIGGEQYVEMTDVEALVRSRLQPTFDEISDRAEKERARQLEARLDEEERQRYEAIWRERELDTLAEEKRYREMQKQQLKEKGQKSRLWKRKSKRYEEPAQPVVTHEEPQDVDQVATGAVAPGAEPPAQATAATQTQAVTQAETVPQVETAPPVETAPQVEAVPGAESAPQATAVSRAEAVPQTQTVSQAAPQVESAPQATVPPGDDVPPVLETERDQVVEGESEERVVASGAAMETPPLDRQESRFKSWFKDRLGRRSTGSGPDSLKDNEVGEEAPASTGFAGGAALAETDSRTAALRSHPVTGNDLVLMQQRMSVDEGNPGRSSIGTEDAAHRVSSSAAEYNGNGENRRPSRLRSSFMKILSGNSQENKANGVSNVHDEPQTASEPAEHSAISGRQSTLEREELREGAGDQGFAVPPPIGKYATNGSRGSRFSENL